MYSRSISPQRTSRCAISASGARKCSQNWRYARHGASGSRALERERVDQDGTAAVELDVVRGGVAEGEPGCLRRDRLCLERHQRRILQLLERPFVGIRDERELLRADAPRGRSRERAASAEIGLVVADQQALPLEARRGRPTGQGVPALLERAIDLPQDDAVAAEDEAARIAERADLGPISRVRWRHGRRRSDWWR